MFLRRKTWKFFDGVFVFGEIFLLEKTWECFEFVFCFLGDLEMCTNHEGLISPGPWMSFFGVFIAIGFDC